MGYFEWTAEWLPVTLNGLPNRPIEWVSLSTVDLIFKINNYINKTS